LANHQAVEDKTTHATLQPFFPHRRHPIDAAEVRLMVFRLLLIDFDLL
jgi:hypothetical protein